MPAQRLAEFVAILFRTPIHRPLAELRISKLQGTGRVLTSGMTVEASEYQTAEKLRDGSTIVIRAIHPDDRERFRHAFQQSITNPDSVRFRFHGFKRSIGESESHSYD
jgi:hypothetical protein